MSRLKGGRNCVRSEVVTTVPYRSEQPSPAQPRTPGLSKLNGGSRQSMLNLNRSFPHSRVFAPSTKTSFS